MIIHPHETVDLLGIKDYKIIQSADGFKFGIDAVLLANFTKPLTNAIGVDLGSGTGIIPIIIVAKSNIKKMIGVELQKDVCEMAARSVELNRLEERIELLNINIKDVPLYFGKHQYDLVISNPPYYKMNTLSSSNEKKCISRHESAIALEDIFENASYLLKPQKSFYLIHKPERLVELIESARRYSLEPKEIQFVHPNINRPANLVLIRYTKYGKQGIKFKKPLFVYRLNGEYTEDIKKIYQSDRLGE